MFLGLHCTGSDGFGFKIIWRLISLNGNQRSICTSWGFSGSSGNLSITTFRGGGGSNSPGIVITFSAGGCGGAGGISRTTNGSGSIGLHGTWRMITNLW